MARVNAQQLIEKYKRRAGAASQDYKEGIQRTTVNPMEEAIKAKPAWEQGLREAIADNRWEKGLQAVPVSEWKDAAMGKGTTNYSQGVTQLSASAERAMTENLADIEAVESEIAPMPKGTFPQRVERSVAWQTKMHERKRRG